MADADGDVRVSVVIPAYNEAGYLAAALTSLQEQDYLGGYEVIVVDNDSTDDTVALARRYGAQVVSESRRGVCSARQQGTQHARGEIVVSTDADTVHPRDWLSRLDRQFRARPEIVAVAGPCRYQEPPWWAVVFPTLWFAAVAVVYAVTRRVFYVSATNLAFRREGFPGYDTTLTQGGDEIDLLRRLSRRGPVVWDAGLRVVTSSRRMDQGLLHTLFVSFGYYYALSYVLNRLTSRTVLGAAPAIRQQHAEQVRRLRLRWRAVWVAGAVGLAALAWVHSDVAVALVGLSQFLAWR